MLKALIFDVDGTLADTESVHRAAFNHAFAQVGLGWEWTEDIYTGLLGISGGKERITHYWMQSHPGTLGPGGKPVPDTVARIHALKTAHYEAVVTQGGVNLRPGVLALIQEAMGAGLCLAIATTTSPANVAALLSTATGPDWRLNFAAIGDASTAPVKKPHPQVYLQILQALKLQPSECLAFEDSANGLAAATAAGLATIITPTSYTRHHDFGAALCVVPDLSVVHLAAATQWHASYFRRH